MSKKLTRLGARNVSETLDRVANLIQEEAAVFGIDPKIAQDFALRCDILSDAIEKRAIANFPRQADGASPEIAQELKEDANPKSSDINLNLNGTSGPKMASLSDANDPRWVVAKTAGQAIDGTPFKPGAKVLLLPTTKTILVGSKADEAFRTFQAQVASEDFDSRTAVDEEGQSVPSPGWDADLIGDVRPPLEVQPDEAGYMSSFDQDNFHELGELTENGGLSNGIKAASSHGFNLFA